MDQMNQPAEQHGPESAEFDRPYMEDLPADLPNGADMTEDDIADYLAKFDKPANDGGNQNANEEEAKQEEVLKSTEKGAKNTDESAEDDGLSSVFDRFAPEAAEGEEQEEVDTGPQIDWKATVDFDGEKLSLNEIRQRAADTNYYMDLLNETEQKLNALMEIKPVDLPDEVDPHLLAQGDQEAMAQQLTRQNILERHNARVSEIEQATKSMREAIAAKQQETFENMMKKANTELAEMHPQLADPKVKEGVDKYIADTMKEIGCTPQELDGLARAALTSPRIYTLMVHAAERISTLSKNNATKASLKQKPTRVKATPTGSRPNSDAVNKRIDEMLKDPSSYNEEDIADVLTQMAA